MTKEDSTGSNVNKVLGAKMKNRFIGYVEGYICTTDVDSHGDKLTPETIEDIKDQIERDSKLHTMFWDMIETKRVVKCWSLGSIQKVNGEVYG